MATPWLAVGMLMVNTSGNEDELAQRSIGLQSNTAAQRSRGASQITTTGLQAGM
jgi:hypothetical protein